MEFDINAFLSRFHKIDFLETLDGIILLSFASSQPDSSTELIFFVAFWRSIKYYGS